MFLTDLDRHEDLLSETSRDTEPHVRTPHVLIAHSYSPVPQGVVSFLEDTGYRVEEVDGIAAALVALGRSDVSVVVVSQDLARSYLALLDAWEKVVPIIVLTQHASLGDESMLRDSRVFAVITRPFGLAQVIDAVAGATGWPRSGEAIPTPSAPVFEDRGGHLRQCDGTVVAHRSRLFTCSGADCATPILSGGLMEGHALFVPCAEVLGADCPICSDVWRECDAVVRS